MSLDSNLTADVRRQGQEQTETLRMIAYENYPSKRSCRLLLPPAPVFLLTRRGRRSPLPSLAKLHDPEAGVNVVEVDQPVLRLRAPAERQVRTIALCVSGPDATDFASLPIQVPAQLA